MALKKLMTWIRCTCLNAFRGRPDAERASFARDSVNSFEPASLHHQHGHQEYEFDFCECYQEYNPELLDNSLNENIENFWKLA